MEKKKDEMMSYFKKYTFDKSKFKLGMRTFKTGIAVFFGPHDFWFFWMEGTSDWSSYSRF